MRPKRKHPFQKRAINGKAEYPNRGKRWTQKQDEKLLRMLEHRKECWDIVEALGRTYCAIQTRYLMLRTMIKFSMSKGGVLGLCAHCKKPRYVGRFGITTIKNACRCLCQLPPLTSLTYNQKSGAYEP